METDNIQKVNVPLKGKNFIPFYGLLDYARRCDNEKADVTKYTAMKHLALIGYNFVIFGALAAETANGLVKLLQQF